MDKNQESSGSSHDEDDDEDDNGKSSGETNSESHVAAPIKMDEDPRGEPVVAKMVHQPIKFNDAPGKNAKILKQKKVVKKVQKDAKPKVEKKKVSTKVNKDKAVKKVKHVKKV